jgi:hypothetical protein
VHLRLDELPAIRDALSRAIDGADKSSETIR